MFSYITVWSLHDNMEFCDWWLLIVYIIAVQVWNCVVHDARCLAFPFILELTVCWLLTEMMGQWILAHLVSADGLLWLIDSWGVIDSKHSLWVLSIRYFQEPLYVFPVHVMMNLWSIYYILGDRWSPASIISSPPHRAVGVALSDYLYLLFVFHFRYETHQVIWTSRPKSFNKAIVYNFNHFII